MIRNWFKIIVLLFVFGSAAFADEVPSFKRQVIKISSDAQFNYGWKYVWEELNGDSLVDLLVVSPAGKVFLHYQESSGFSGAAKQSWKLPEDAVWFRVADVSEDPNAEIVISTGDGVKYYRQVDGVFETNPRVLIEAKQVFARNPIRVISYFDRSRYWKEKVDGGIPVIFADGVVIYESDKQYKYKAAGKIELEHKSEIWKWGRSKWSLGGKGGNALWVTTKAKDKADLSEKGDSEEENEYIKKMIEKIKGHELQGHYIIAQDINGDDKKDVTLVHLMQNIDLKTNLMIFFRREDYSLPEEPDQILRCRGIPVVGDYPGPREVSPFIDTNKDGLADIVMMELKDRPVSPSSLVKIVISRGLDWVLTVRLFRKEKGFNNRADFSMDIATMLPTSEQFGDVANFDGDFNGDGRPDLLIRRSPTQSYVYLSSVSNGFFNPKSQLKLEVPAEGWTAVKDLNGDGVSDVYLIDYGKGEITVFLSERSNKKGAVE